MSRSNLFYLKFLYDSHMKILKPKQIFLLFKGKHSFWGILILAFLAGLFLISQKLQPCDDAFITFRHAKNLSDHLKLTWNLEGAPVLGSTSPLYVFNLALFSRVFGHVPLHEMALILNVVLLFFIVILVYLIGLDLTGRRVFSFFIAFLIGFNSINIFVFSQGFENALLIFLLFGGCYAARKNQISFALIFASITPLVRPEGLLLCLFIWPYLFIRRDFKKRYVLIFSIIPLLWLIFSIAYYGNPIPHPIYAKKMFSLIYRPYLDQDLSLFDQLRNLPHQGLWLWNTHLKPHLFQGGINPTGNQWGTFFLYGITIFSLPFFFFKIYKKPDGRILYFLYPFGFFLLYSWIHHYNHWYSPSFISFSILLLFYSSFLGLKKGFIFFNKHTKKAIPENRFYFYSLLLIFFIFLSTNQFQPNFSNTISFKGWLFAKDPRGINWEIYERERFLNYREAAFFLNKSFQPNDRVLINEVGTFGYFYKGNVLDAVGICSPEALQYYPPPRSDIFDERGSYLSPANNIVPRLMINSEKPTYLVNSEIYISHLLKKDADFLKNYEEIWKMGRVWGSPLYIYRLRKNAS